MKRSLLLLISLLMGCQTDKEAGPLLASVEEFEVVALGVGGDCRRPMIRFQDKLTEAEQIIGTTSLGGVYYANGLSLEFRSGQVLLVRIRKIMADEQRPCITLGPSYSWLTVVSVRKK